MIFNGMFVGFHVSLDDLSTFDEASPSTNMIYIGVLKWDSEASLRCHQLSSYDLLGCGGA